MIQYRWLLFLAVFQANTLSAQTITNGDLDGPEITSLSILPDGWEIVPFDDPVSIASLYNDVPDLCDINGPYISNGIYGNPYAGQTFLSGIRGRNLSNDNIWQEGIMQTVSDFMIDSTYEITFYQAVVKQTSARDTSGSWAVYFDTTLIGITAPTSSLIPFDEAPFVWEQRKVIFTATSHSHTLKFLPLDDDDNDIQNDPEGAIRMGIDLISINLVESISTSYVEASKAFECDVYPNPVRDWLRIDLGSDRSAVQVRVFTLSGMKVLEKTFSGTTFTLDLSGLEQGVYKMYIEASGKYIFDTIIKL